MRPPLPPPRTGEGGAGYRGVARSAVLLTARPVAPRSRPAPSTVLQAATARPARATARGAQERTKRVISHLRAETLPEHARDRKVPGPADRARLRPDATA